MSIFFLYRRGVHNQLPGTPLPSGHKHLSANNPTSGLALTLSAIGSPCSLTRAPSRPPLAICVRARCILTFAIDLICCALSKEPARAAGCLFNRPPAFVLGFSVSPSETRPYETYEPQLGDLVLRFDRGSYQLAPQMGLFIRMFNSNQVRKIPANWIAILYIPLV